MPVHGKTGSVLNLLFLLLSMTASPLKDWQSLISL